MRAGLRRLLCRLFGHDRMPTSGKFRTCLRCGKREAERYFGKLRAWEEVTTPGAGRVEP